jgi:hypothetical protein
LIKAFSLNEKKFNKRMEFLLENGLVKRSGEQYVPGTTENYLEKESLYARQLHLNTRSQALTSLDRELPDDAHYSALVTLSTKDVTKIKKIISESLSSIIEVAKESKEEKIYGLSLDFFDMEKT